MKKRTKKKIINLSIIATFTIGAVIICGVLLVNYWERINEESEKIMEKTDTLYASNAKTANDSGLYIANIKDDISKYIDGKEVTSVTYMFEDESFSLEIKVIKDDGNISFSIDKIVDETLDINARMNLSNVISVEYRSAEYSDETILKINSEYNDEYFAMTKGSYYLLGDDIESISYIDEHFYYVSYNPSYRVLDEAESCSKEVKSSIDGFSTKDYYYKYGRINFLPEYYQKLSTKTYTVGDRCDELEAKQTPIEEQ